MTDLTDRLFERVKGTYSKLKLMAARILIIEDNEINCMIYRKVFGPAEYILDFACDGLLGIQKFEANPYDLILLDLGLPKIDGISVAVRMRVHEKDQGSSNVPIIVVTADDSFSTKKKALKAGVDHYVSKPFSIENIKLLVAMCLLNSKILISK